MTWQVAARGPSRGKPAAVVLTPEEGSPVALPVPQARTLQHDLLNAVLRLERAEREGALGAKVRVARRRERQAAKAAEIRENDG